MQQKNSEKKKDSNESGRIPPSDLQAEQAVLGAILADPLALSRIQGVLTVESFYWTKHQLIFAALLILTTASEPTDYIAVSVKLKAEGNLDKVGGDYYLTELGEAVPFPTNVEYYAKTVRSKHQLRRLAVIGETIGSDSFRADADPAELTGRGLDELFKLGQDSSRGRFHTSEELVNETIDELDEIAKRGGGISGVPSGFKNLDLMTGGWQNSNLILIAALPSMGKSALAVSMMINAAKSQIPVGFMTLEDSKGSMTKRMLAIESGVSGVRIRRAQMTPEEWRRVNDAAGVVAALPIHVNDTSMMTLLDVQAQARMLKKRHDIGLLFVDYLQLMHHPDMVRYTNQVVGSFSSGLKALAKDLDVPVIALSQLSRAVITRGGSKRPILSDLRDSGSLEQDADEVVFIHRDYYHHQEDEEAEKRASKLDISLAAYRRQAELRIAKQRNGPTGSIEVVFESSRSVFLPLERDVGEHEERRDIKDNYLDGYQPDNEKMF